MKCFPTEIKQIREFSVRETCGWLVCSFVAYLGHVCHQHEIETQVLCPKKPPGQAGWQEQQQALCHFVRPVESLTLGDFFAS